MREFHVVGSVVRDKASCRFGRAEWKEASRRGFDSACPSSVLRDSLLDAHKSLL